MFLDGLNNFHVLASVVPIALKSYVSEQIAAATGDLKIAQAEITARLQNLQLMIIELNIQLIDGQVNARRTETAQLQSQLGDPKTDFLLRSRLGKLDDEITKLLKQRDRLSCYSDKILGYNVICN